MYRAQFFFQFPQDDPTEITEKAELGEYISDRDDIWKALDEARTKREPIAMALMGAYPSLHYVRFSEVEIHLRPWDPQLGLFTQPALIDGGPQPS
jgi:hypothetical protein